MKTILAVALLAVTLGAGTNDDKSFYAENARMFDEVMRAIDTLKTERDFYRSKWLQGTNNTTSVTITNVTLCVPILLTKLATRLETNYASIGTFTDKIGNAFDVQEGTRATNTVIEVDFEGKRQEFVLKSVKGDKCSERKIRNINAGTILTNTFFFPTNFSIYQRGGLVGQTLLSSE